MCVIISKIIYFTFALTPLFEKASVLCEATRNVSEGQSVEIATEINELKESYKTVVGAIKAFLGL